MMTLSPSFALRKKATAWSHFAFGKVLGATAWSHFAFGKVLGAAAWSHFAYSKVLGVTHCRPANDRIKSIAGLICSVGRYSLGWWA